MTVDWLNATFLAPDMSPEGFVGLLGRMLGRPVSAEERKGGLLGFEKCFVISAYHGSRKGMFASLAWGGEGQRGRWLLQIPGAGCRFVQDWKDLRVLLEDLGARITRLDLALDVLDGQASVETALAWSEAGLFASSGRPPSTRVAGDWLDGRAGQSFYVGKAENGKMLRVYEKGRQLGDPDSDWVRWEVQFGNRDRVIPFEALTDRDAYFAGAYPALQGLLNFAGEKIKTSRTEGEVSLGWLVMHARRSYGKLIDTLRSAVGIDSSDLVEEIRVIGTPRRVHLTSADAGLDADEIFRMRRRA